MQTPINPDHDDIVARRFLSKISKGGAETIDIEAAHRHPERPLPGSRFDAAVGRLIAKGRLNVVIPDEPAIAAPPVVTKIEKQETVMPDNTPNTNPVDVAKAADLAIVRKARADFDAVLASVVKSSSEPAWERYHDVVLAHPEVYVKANPAPQPITKAEMDGRWAAVAAQDDALEDLAARYCVRQRDLGEPVSKDAAIAHVSQTPAGEAILEKRAELLEQWDARRYPGAYAADGEVSKSAAIFKAMNDSYVDKEAKYYADHAAAHVAATGTYERAMTDWQIGLRKGTSLHHAAPVAPVKREPADFITTTEGARLVKMIHRERELGYIEQTCGGAEALRQRKQLAAGTSTPVDKRTAHGELEQLAKSLAAEKGISLTLAYGEIMETSQRALDLYRASQAGA